MLLLTLACTKTPPSEPWDSADPLPVVFRSGFEEGTEHLWEDGPDCSDDLRGVDQSVELGDWEGDLEGGPFESFQFCFGGGDRSQRRIDLVPDPEDADNQVLRGQIFEPAQVIDDDDIACNGDDQGARKARIQARLKAPDEGAPTAIRYSARVRLSEEAFGPMVAQGEDEISWLTLAEFWNDNTDDAHPFRVTINLVKPAEAGAPLRFMVESDRKDGEWIHVWPEDEQDSGVDVPIGAWFTLDMLVVEGDADTGRVVVRVTEEDGTEHLVADVTNWTYSPVGQPNGFQTLNPLKLYTSGGLMCRLEEEGIPLEIHWDDFEIAAD